VPELPDVTLYLDALGRRALHHRLERVRLASPFLLRTVEPPLAAVAGTTLVGLRRLGKRIVFELGDQLFLVLHLMIAGRLRWKPRGTPIARKLGLAAFDFDTGSVLLTEAGTKKRASLHLVRGADALAALDPGGIEPLEADDSALRAALSAERHTVKRALTDPRLVAGIGNAYSDEILHAARLSPVRMTDHMTDEEWTRLVAAIRSTLRGWVERLRAETRDAWPDKVTAFRPGMAVHGRYGEACPVCGTRVARIVHAANETNYCPGCQTGGTLLADRSLSRVLHADWPRTAGELEEHTRGPRR
jgi:formamidopyrimidine-DNA glycosylase